MAESAARSLSTAASEPAPASHQQRVLTITQRKGGAGKTMLARMLAEYEASVKKRRTLLVDLDNQCNISCQFLDMEGVNSDTGFRPPVNPEYNPATDEEDLKRSSSANIFFTARFLPFGVPLPGFETLDILPGHTQQLIEVERQEKTPREEPVRNQIRKVFADPTIQAAYDLIIFDTGPRGSLLDQAALRASTHILIPVEPEQNCMNGLPLLAGMMRDENRSRQRGSELKLVGLQINKYSNTGEHQRHVDDLKRHPEFGSLICPTYLPRLTAFTERDRQSAKPRSIFGLSPNNSARIAAEDFVTYVDETMFGGGN